MKQVEKVCHSSVITINVWDRLGWLRTNRFTQPELPNTHTYWLDMHTCDTHLHIMLQNTNNNERSFLEMIDRNTNYNCTSVPIYSYVQKFLIIWQ